MTEQEINALIESAQKGDLKAAAELNQQAWNLQNGKNGCEQNLPKAFEYYKIAADAGDVTAITNYAYCLVNAVGTEKNNDLAFSLYKKAAELGNNCGLANLGWCYEQGIGTEKALSKAALYYAKGYAAGFEWAKQQFKNLNIDPDITELTKEEIVAISKIFKTKSFGSSIDNLDEIDKIVKWNKYAAIYGDLDALRTMADCYEFGWGCDVDHKKVVECREKASELGDWLSTAELLDIYKGKKFEELQVRDTDKVTKLYDYILQMKPQDEHRYEEAFKWYLSLSDVINALRIAELSAEKGLKMQARFDLEVALLYDANFNIDTFILKRPNDSRIEENLDKALSWYEKGIAKWTYECKDIHIIERRVQELKNAKEKDRAEKESHKGIKGFLSSLGNLLK